MSTRWNDRVLLFLCASAPFRTRSNDYDNTSVPQVTVYVAELSTRGDNSENHSKHVEAKDFQHHRSPWHLLKLSTAGYKIKGESQGNGRFANGTLVVIGKSARTKKFVADG